MSRRISILILLALSIGIYAGTSAWPPLLDSSDAGHAEAAREMLESHNWVILHINGIRYLEKPPLPYWLVAASYAVLGVSAFATRFPLAIFVVALVLMVYFFGRRWFGERAGFYAGLVMCTSPGVFLFTRIMIPEAIYAFFFTAAFYLCLRAWQGTIAERPAYWGAAALIALAVLTRSLIGIVFPVGIFFFFMLATGRLKEWRRLPLISSAIVFLIVALPWHIAALFSGRGFFGGFFWFYFINEQIFRAIGWRYPADYEAVPLWLWVAELIVWFFPWIAFLPWAIREMPKLRSWRKGLDERGQALVLLTVWALFILLFFSWTKSRMEYYSFSAWPAIAILLGVGLARAEEMPARWLPRVQGALAALGALIAALLGGMLWISRGIASTGDISSLMQLHPAGFYRVAMSDFMDLTPQAFADLRHQALAAMIVIAGGFFGAWLLRRRGRHLAASMTLGCMMAAFFFCANWAFGVFTPRLSSEPIAKIIMKYYQPGDKIALYGEYDAGSSLGFYTRKRIWIFNGRYNGLEFGSYYPDAPHIFLNDYTFWPVWRGSERVFLVVPPEQTQAALVRMPPNGTFLLTQIGGKTVYVNHRITPDEPSLAQLREHAERTGDISPAAALSGKLNGGVARKRS
ncbi:MAG TPA: glycosyltransferase family 39 protein [Candidatus Limnocylindrales bacterium]|nr:glycosyltransferase family 39 protein [Candidatus Limnocylindrales bacterium]